MKHRGVSLEAPAPAFGGHFPSFPPNIWLFVVLRKAPAEAFCGSFFAFYPGCRLLQGAPCRASRLYFAVILLLFHSISDILRVSLGTSMKAESGDPLQRRRGGILR